MDGNGFAVVRVRLSGAVEIVRHGRSLRFGAPESNMMLKLRVVLPLSESSRLWASALDLMIALSKGFSVCLSADSSSSVDVKE